ncbi:unnamed protein product [Owenia fusiformis]|uniref:Uncharacterized protein n=1 Tax=Owenia fusiformis TaxID=6347 RepID=A0A8J1XXP4_OWEFU|nr:unnamed protein product [Owenia fusiformis]
MKFKHVQHNSIGDQVLSESERQAVKLSDVQKRIDDKGISQIVLERRRSLDMIIHAQKDMEKHLSKINHRKGEIIREKYEAQESHGNRFYTKTVEETILPENNRICLPADKAKALLRTVLSDSQAQREIMLRETQHSNQTDNPSNQEYKELEDAPLEESSSKIGHNDADVHDNNMVNYNGETNNTNNDNCGTYVTHMTKDDKSCVSQLTEPNRLTVDEPNKDDDNDSHYEVVHSHVPHSLPSYKHLHPGKSHKNVHVHFGDSETIEINTIELEEDDDAQIKEENSTKHCAENSNITRAHVPHPPKGIHAQHKSRMKKHGSDNKDGHSANEQGTHHHRLGTENVEHLPLVQEVPMIQISQTNEQQRMGHLNNRRLSISNPSSPNFDMDGHGLGRRRSGTWPKKPENYDDLKNRVLQKKTFSFSPNASNESLSSQRSPRSPLANVPNLRTTLTPSIVDSTDSLHGESNRPSERLLNRRVSLPLNSLSRCQLLQPPELSKRRTSMSSSENIDLLAGSSEKLHSAQPDKPPLTRKNSASFQTMSTFFNSIRDRRMSADETMLGNGQINVNKSPIGSKGSSEMHKWLEIESKGQLKKMTHKSKKKT